LWRLIAPQDVLRVVGMQVRDLISTAVFCCAAALSVAAVPLREVSGVNMPEVVRGDDNKELRLNGIGLRKEKAFFKVYVIALYLERPTTNARAAIMTDEEKRIVISMLRDLSREQFVQAVEAAIIRNSSSEMPILRSRLDLLEDALPAPRKGNVLSFTYLPGVGTVMRGQGRELTIRGKDFADALLSVWLGPKPIGGALKHQLLAG
jgi:hypothetical protein